MALIAASSLSSSAPLIPLGTSRAVLSRIAQIFGLVFDEGTFPEQQVCFDAVLDACRQNRWQLITTCQNEITKLTDQLGRSLLIYAIDAGERELSRGLATQRITLHTPDKEGNTPFHSAARAGDVELISILYRHILLEAKNNKGQTALHVAIEAGQTDVVRALLSSGANKEAPFLFDNFLLLTPLAYAVVCGQQDSIQLLCQHINLATITTFLGNLLHLAAYFHQNDTLRYLLREHTQAFKPLLDNKTPEGHTPLALAVFAENPHAVYLLKVSGANLET
ncbi:MAG: ankyrin repeat domain-containing protein, partial [Thermodesulfobacteriota bacterium]